MLDRDPLVMADDREHSRSRFGSHLRADRQQRPHDEYGRGRCERERRDGADGVDLAPEALRRLEKFRACGFGALPICMASAG